MCQGRYKFKGLLQAGMFHPRSTPSKASIQLSMVNAHTISSHMYVSGVVAGIVVVIVSNYIHVMYIQRMELLAVPLQTHCVLESCDMHTLFVII